MQNVIIGTNEYTNLIASLGPTVEHSTRLGQGFFRRHVCYFDFPNQKLYLLPGEHFRDQDEENMSGMYPLRIAGKMMVYSVEQGSPAFEAGIRQDDELISINGQKAAPLKLKAISEMLRSQPGAKIAVDVRRGGKALQFAFVLKRSI